MVLVVRGYMRQSHGSVAIDLREEDLWGEVSLPRDTKASGLAISTPHGCVVVIGVDMIMGGERVLVASFLDPLDPTTIEIIEGASKTKRIVLMRSGSPVGVLNLSQEDLGKMEYVASKTKECSKMQDKPINIELAAQWFIENLSI